MIISISFELLLGLIGVIATAVGLSVTFTIWWHDRRTKRRRHESRTHDDKFLINVNVVEEEHGRMYLRPRCVRKNEPIGGLFSDAVMAEKVAAAAKKCLDPNNPHGRLVVLDDPADQKLMLKEVVHAVSELYRNWHGLRMCDDEATIRYFGWVTLTFEPVGNEALHVLRVQTILQRDLRRFRDPKFRAHLEFTPGEGDHNDNVAIFARLAELQYADASIKNLVDTEIVSRDAEGVLGFIEIPIPKIFASDPRVNPLLQAIRLSQRVSV